MGAVGASSPDVGGAVARMRACIRHARAHTRARRSWVLCQMGPPRLGEEVSGAAPASKERGDVWRCLPCMVFTRLSPLAAARTGDWLLASYLLLIYTRVVLTVAAPR